MTENIDSGYGWLGRALLGLLALVSLACIAAGGFLYGWIVIDWSQGTGGFSGLQMIGWLAGLIAAAVIGAGLVLAGLLFRLLKWSRARLASLVLSVVSTGFILMTYLVYSDTGNGGNSIEVVLLRIGCIFGLFIVALPPFLHWLLGRPPIPVDTAAREGVAK